MKKVLIAGALFACLSVMIGAFGAHALNATLGSYKDTYETGVTYQMFHALVLIFTGILLERDENKPLKVAGVLFIIGICLFSGSLYFISITKITLLGMVAPFGGLSFIAGWVSLMIGIARLSRTTKQY